MEMHLYPKFTYKAKSFKGCKRTVVPNQSMSLREIIKRFVRREPLPLFKEGVYEERFGDLEKMSREDIIQQMETVEGLKNAIAAFKKRRKAQEDKAKADAAAASTAPPVNPANPPVGETVKNPPS